MVRIFKKIVEVFAEAGGYAALLMALVIIINIVLRIIWKPLVGTYELIGILSVVFASFAVSYAALEKNHISVTFLIDYLPNRIRKLCQWLVGILGLFIIGLMAWSGGLFALKQWYKKEMTDALYIPLAPFRMVWVIALFLYIFILFIQMASLIKKQDK